MGILDRVSVMVEKVESKTSDLINGSTVGFAKKTIGIINGSTVDFAKKTIF